MRKSIKLGIAEDHKVMRQGLVNLITRAQGVKCVLDVSNGQELIEELKETEVDVLLLDLQMPIMTGQLAMGIIREKYPNVKVIVLSMHYENNFIMDCIELGARAFLPKDIDFEDLLDAIFSVHDRGYYFDDKVTETLFVQVATQRGKRPINNPSRLTDHEIEILKEICEGSTNPQMADKFNVSVRTIESHKTRMMRKTKSINVVKLVMYAIQNGLYSVKTL